MSEIDREWLANAIKVLAVFQQRAESSVLTAKSESDKADYWVEAQHWQSAINEIQNAMGYN